MRRLTLALVMVVGAVVAGIVLIGCGDADAGVIHLSPPGQTQFVIGDAGPYHLDYLIGPAGSTGSCPFTVQLVSPSGQTVTVVPGASSATGPSSDPYGDVYPVQLSSGTWTVRVAGPCTWSAKVSKQADPGDPPSPATG